MSEFEDGIRFSLGIVAWAEEMARMSARGWLRDRGHFAEWEDMPVCTCGKRVLLPAGGSCCDLTQYRASEALKTRHSCLRQRQEKP